MNRLIHGYIRFRSHAYPQMSKLYTKLAGGQNPEFMFITCADSRVEPYEFTSAGPGDLFMERSLGNVVPAPGEGQTEPNPTVEYAVTALNVQHIVVCGHTGCGAMQAILDPDLLKPMPTVSAWLKGAGITREMVMEKHPGLEGAALLAATVRENVLIQVEHVRQQPAVVPRLADGRVTVHGWVFEIEHGRVLGYDARVNAFVPLIQAYTETPLKS